MYSYKHRDGQRHIYMLPLKAKDAYITDGYRLNTFVFGRMFLSHYYAIFDVEL